MTDSQDSLSWMRKQIELSRDALLSATDSVCLERAHLVTQAYHMHESEPMPIRRALAFAHILRKMTLDLDSTPILAGNMSSVLRAWMLLPEYGFVIPGQALIENPALAGLLDGDAIPASIRAYWERPTIASGSDIGHLIPCHAAVLSQGLHAKIAQLEQCDVSHSAEQLVHRRASAIACRAVVDWATRYALAAEEKAHTASPQQAMMLRRMADACRRVPAEPARDLYEALQAIVLVHLAIHIEGHGYSVSTGRLDQLLLPFYRDDLDVAELLEAFILKLAANSLWGSHSKTQTITVGGADADGNDQCNALTLHIMNAVSSLRLPDPALFLRWHDRLNSTVKRKALIMLTDHVSMPMLIGDTQTVAGLLNAGVNKVDAWNYGVVGCNELGVPGALIFDSVLVNEIGLLRNTLLEEEHAALGDLDALIGRMTQRMIPLLREQVLEKMHQQRAWALQVPTPFTTAMMRNVAERGEDMHASLEYQLLNVRAQGFANLINALAAIESVVYAVNKVSLSDIACALRNDFEGADALRQLLLKAPKWGNGNTQVDGIAGHWLRARESAYRAVERETGSPRLVAELVVRSLNHLEGRTLGATPDGRKAGEPLADSVGAVLGSYPESPTVVMNSVSGMESAQHWQGGYNFNLTLPATDWRGEEMLDRLQALVDVFFARGGQELQLNCLDAAMLRDAQAHPQQHRDLLVRISGFNARFTQLSAVEQDELIQRAEESMRA